MNCSMHYILKNLTIFNYFLWIKFVGLHRKIWIYIYQYKTWKCLKIKTNIFKIWKKGLSVSDFDHPKIHAGLKKKNKIFKII